MVISRRGGGDDLNFSSFRPGFCSFGLYPPRDSARSWLFQQRLQCLYVNQAPWFDSIFHSLTYYDQVCETWRSVPDKVGVVWIFQCVEESTDHLFLNHRGFYLCCEFPPSLGVCPEWLATLFLHTLELESVRCHFSVELVLWQEGSG